LLKQKFKVMTTIEFTSHLNKVSKNLKPFAIRLTRDAEDANDLIQETLLKAFTYRDKFTTGTNLKAWLFTIMKNTFITNYQRLVRRNTFIDSTENLHYINSTIVTDNEASGKFLMDDIQKAISQIEEVYSTPFIMHFKGFKYFEISEKLDIPIGTVKNRIHIARKELKDILKNYAFSY